MLNEFPQAVSRWEMWRTQFEGEINICQYIRDTYRITKQRDVRWRLRIIMAMGKAMNKRLREYKVAFEMVKNTNDEVIVQLNKLPQNIYGEIGDQNAVPSPSSSK